VNEEIVVVFDRSSANQRGNLQQESEELPY